MTITSKNTFRFSAIPVKFPMAFFTELESKKKKKQFVWDCKKPQRAKSILRKKNDAEEIWFPDFRLYYKATVIKVKSLSHVRFFVTAWTVVYQAPLSMGFSRQEC